MGFLENVIAFRRQVASAHDGPVFSELAEEWFAAESQRLVAPENERRHINHLKAIWTLAEGELRPRIVKETLAALLGELSPQTINKVRGTGRRIIREARLNDRWKGPNPFDDVQRMREARPTHRPLSLTECRLLLPQLRADRRREAITMLYLGLRPGEIKGLQKIDVDLRTGVLTVRRSNGRDSTKTGKVRVVPIPDGLLPHLKEAILASPDACGLVFPTKGGGMQDPHSKLSRMLKHGLRKAGLVSGFEYSCRRKGCGHREVHPLSEERWCPKCNFKLWEVGVPLQVRFYDLRHSAATLHREAGADPLAIQVALGHAAENLTDSIYTHLSMEYLRRELNKLQL